MLAVRRILPKLLDWGTGRDLTKLEPSRELGPAYRSRKDSRNIGRPATDWERELEGVDDVLRKCSVFATSLTSYLSEIKTVLDDERE
jgi:hypothetical protein